MTGGSTFWDAYGAIHFHKLNKHLFGMHTTECAITLRYTHRQTDWQITVNWGESNICSQRTSNFHNTSFQQVVLLVVIVVVVSWNNLSYVDRATVNCVWQVMLQGGTDELHILHACNISLAVCCACFTCNYLLASRFSLVAALYLVTCHAALFATSCKFDRRSARFRVPWHFATFVVFFCCSSTICHVN